MACRANRESTAKVAGRSQSLYAEQLAGGCLITGHLDVGAVARCGFVQPICPHCSRITRLEQKVKDVYEASLLCATSLQISCQGATVSPTGGGSSGGCR